MEIPNIVKRVQEIPVCLQCALEIPYYIPTRPGISPEFLLQCAGNPRYIYITGYESFSDDDCMGAFPKEMEQ